MSENTQLAVRLPKPTTEAAKHVVDHITRFSAALPSFIDPEQFAYATVVAANEIEKECTPVSVLSSAHNCAKMGLMPGKALGLAYFVPFWNKNIGANECQLIPGYRGYLDLAYQNNFLKDVYTEVIREGEEFRHWVDSNGVQINHEIPLTRIKGHETITGAYGICRLTNGGLTIKVMSRGEIDAAIPDNVSDAWKFHFPSQAMKTVLRRMAKQWRLTSQMALAVHLDEQVELGKPQQLLADVGDLPTLPPAQRQRTLGAPTDDTPADEPPNGEMSDQDKKDAIDAEIADMANA